MSVRTAVSGRVSLLYWDEPLATEGVIELILELRRFRARVHQRLLVILLARAPALAERVSNTLRAALPMIFDCASEVLVVVEGGDTARDLLCAIFSMTSLPSRSAGVHVFPVLGDAFSYAQRIAPHEVLNLQRFAMRERISARKQ